MTPLTSDLQEIANDLAEYYTQGDKYVYPDLTVQQVFEKCKAEVLAKLERLIQSRERAARIDELELATIKRKDNWSDKKYHSTRLSTLSNNEEDNHERS